jgi:hypothetical protein
MQAKYWKTVPNAVQIRCPDPERLGEVDIKIYILKFQTRE